MTVSVALIVKNEEQTLRRCLKSLDGAVDEIVVVDTGSQDATRTVARRFTDRVFDFDWCQDFSAARQYAFDQATGDWVMWVDADDVVHGAEHIQPMTAGAPPEVGAFYWRYVVDRDAWDNVHCSYWRERCVRNDGSYRWVGRVHEVLVSRRGWATVRSPDVVVEHHAQHKHRPDKLQRNLEILEAEAAGASDGNAPAPRTLFYLGREYASAGETAKALEVFSQYLSVATWDEERYLAQGYVADLYRAQGLYEQAIDVDLQALRVCPHWPDAYFGLAESYYYLQDWHKVIHWTEVGRAMPQPDTIHITNPMDYQFNWIIYYTNALYQVGEVEEAQGWTQQALALCPDDPWHRQNFLTFGQRLSDTGKGEMYG